jgi:outer membrane receptor protein involved in Fe transport
MLLGLALSLSLVQANGTGIVRDQSGAAVQGASISVRSGSGIGEITVSGPDGRFVLEKTPDGPATLIVRAVGFAVKEQPFAPGGDIEVVLEPATILETVTVTASRTEERLGNIPASINVLDRTDIRQSPAVVADDVLRQLPTFSLFRRTSSLSSHPTAQGVSLRGIGPSGVSRTLVLIDNVPFNDPFGGWVYWTRVPLDSVDRIEVVDGASSSLYGNYAMGGVINIISGRAARRSVELSTQYGNLNSPKLDFRGSDVWGKLGATIDGGWFNTDGFPIVVAGERGLVDTKATVEFRNLNVKVDYNPTSRISAFVRGGYFREERDNAKVSTFDGTPEGNDTTWKSASGGVRILLPDQSDLQGRVFVDVETFRSNFLAVPNAVTRAIGRMTLDQRVPTKGVGGMLQWSRAVGTRHLVTAGTDWRWVDGDSNEDGRDAVTGLTFNLKRISGGTQRSVGAFVQDLFSPVDRLTLTLSARVDRWQNYDAHNLETSQPSGVPTVNNNPNLPEKDDTVASPHVAAMYRVTQKVNVWGGVSTGFRAPTLNELYRQFRVGQTLTLANAELGPERLVGGELGVNVEPIPNLTVRGTWFDNRMKNPVSNVTILVAGAAITQQRQNLGRTRIRGVQTDVEYRLGSDWRLGAGYLYNDAKVTEDTRAALVGRFLAQVPQHRGSARVAYTNPRLATLALGVQVFGRQFDDDLNVRTIGGSTDPGLPRYAVVDFTASRAMVRNFDVFFGVQNLLDEEYFVGTNPTTIGSPRLVHGGVRVRFSGR